MNDPQREPDLNEAKDRFANDEAGQQPRTGGDASPGPRLVLPDEVMEQLAGAPAGSAGEDDIAVLREKARQCDEYLEKLQRVQADYLNYQKRMQKQMEEARRFASQGFMGDLLSVLDNFERATHAAADATDVRSMVQGIQIVEQQLRKVLADNGLERIGIEENEAFDPNKHEAVAVEPNEELPNQTVIDVLQGGYYMHERVLRPAKVRVSQRTTSAAALHAEEPTEAEPTDEPSETDND